MDNPKKLFGDKKPAIGWLPLAGRVHQSLAHMDGGYKYGFDNWHKNKVDVMTYIHAIERHTELYKCGESHARDTGVHNLGGVMACCALLLDAEINNMLIDNRTYNKAACDLLHNAEVMVEKLKQMQRDRDDAKSAEFDKRLTVAVDDIWKSTSLIAGSDSATEQVVERTKFYTCGQCKTPEMCGAQGGCIG